MVGRATTPKLHKLNIFTIGDLANYDLEILKYKLKSHGLMIWNYANGIDDSVVRSSNYIEMKGIGNSTTMAFDVDDKATAYKFLLSLSETVGMRLRDSGNCSTVVSISLRGSDMMFYGMQKKLDVATDSTRKIYETACFLFDKLWKGNELRHLGVRVTEFCNNDFLQCSILDDFNYEKDSKINTVVDMIRLKYGSDSVMKSCFLHSGVPFMCGGVGEGDYPMMGSIL